MNFNIIILSIFLIIITLTTGLNWMLDYGFAYFFLLISIGTISILFVNKKIKLIFNFYSLLIFTFLFIFLYFSLINQFNFSIITWTLSYVLLVFTDLSRILKDKILNINDTIFKSINIFLFLYIVSKFLNPDQLDSFYLGTGYVIIAFMPFSVYTFYQSKGKLSKLISFLTIFLSLIYLLNYGLRGASIAMFAGIISLIIFSDEKIRLKLSNIKIVYPVVITVLFSLLLAIVLYSTPNLSDTGDGSNIFQKSNTRGFLYIEGINQFLQKPLFGYGLNADFSDIQIDSVSYGVINERENYTAHSDIIHLTYKLGLFGLLIHLYIYSSVLVKLIKSFDNHFAKAGIFATTSGLVFGMTHTFLVAPFALRSTTITIVYAIFVGILNQNYKLKKKTNKAE